MTSTWSPKHFKSFHKIKQKPWFKLIRRVTNKLTLMIEHIKFLESTPIDLKAINFMFFFLQLPHRTRKVTNTSSWLHKRVKQLQYLIKLQPTGVHPSQKVEASNLCINSDLTTCHKFHPFFFVYMINTGRQEQWLQLHHNVINR